MSTDSKRVKEKMFALFRSGISVKKETELMNSSYWCLDNNSVFVCKNNYWSESSLEEFYKIESLVKEEFSTNKNDEISEVSSLAEDILLLVDKSNVNELKELCKKYNISNYSKLKKTELKELLISRLC